MSIEEANENRKQLRPLVRLVNALFTSVISLVVYYLSMISIFTERESFFYDRECWVFCLGLIETLTDPLLLKGALFILALSSVFGFLYWQENLIMKFYERHIRNS